MIHTPSIDNTYPVTNHLFIDRDATFSTLIQENVRYIYHRHLSPDKEGQMDFRWCVTGFVTDTHYYVAPAEDSPKIQGKRLNSYGKKMGLLRIKEKK